MSYYSLGTIISRIAITLFLLWSGTGCSTTQPSMDGGGKKHLQNQASSIKPNQQELLGELNKYRNKLSDIYQTLDNKISDPFRLNEQKLAVNPYQGYRVQLISTSNKQAAVEVMKEYNDWIFQQNTIPYKGNAYIIFKQPDYKIHVGDFQHRDKAIRFAQKLKKKFPGAWIVNDTINPGRIPTDSTATSNSNNQ